MNRSTLSKCDLKRRIMEYDFALYDLNLYLDTHPSDSDTIMTFRALRNTYDQLVDEYVHRFGPLTAKQVTSDNYWTWVSEPWPWEGGAD